MYSLVNFSSSDIIAFMTFSEAVFITALKIVHTSSAEILSFSRTTTYSVFAASGWSREKFVWPLRILAANRSRECHQLQNTDQFCVLTYHIFLSFFAYAYNMPNFRHKKMQRRRRCCKITTALKCFFRSF